MDVKTALNQIDELFEENALSDDQNAAALDAVTRYRTARKKIKELNQRKQLINSQFKQAKGDVEKLATLKNQSKTTAAEIKTVEAELKEQGQILVSLLDVNNQNKLSWPPSRFVHNRIETAAFDYTIRLAEDADAKAWDEYVIHHANGNAYHLFHWRLVIARAFGHKCFYFIAQNSEGDIVGVFPCVWQKSVLFGSFATSVPFFNYGGPLSTFKDIENALIAAAGEQAKLHHWQHLEIRTCRDDFMLPSHQHKVSMILPLPRTGDSLDDELGAKVRAQFKQADRHPVSIKFGKLDLLDDFYRVFAVNMRDLGTPVYSKQFFKEILAEFSEQTTIAVAYFNGKPAGTAFLFGFKDIMEVPWASTIKRYNSYNINMWMYRKILGFAIAKKYDYFDFGRSSIDAGTYKFKKQWGAQPIPHFWYYWLNDGARLPQMNPDNPKFKLVISIWKKLPVSLTKLIGPSIVKNIS